MPCPPTPRKEVYDLYWKFAFERQAIFERRVTGQPKPWTQDPILKTYKFCNVFRAADRESQHLIREAACNAAFDGSDNQLFQIVAYRFFSEIETWRGLKRALGRPPVIADLADGGFTRALEETKAARGKLYTNAFILCANKAFGHDQKYKNHVALFRKMFMQDNLAQRLRKARTLKEIYEVLRSYPLMGDFMSYQVAIDLNYSSQINFSENDFCQAGPGALRGIKKAFVDLGDLSPAQVIGRMVERQTEEFDRLGLPFKGLRGRPLHAIDAQGLFCELDKYGRVAFPQIKSARTRIKAKFQPAGGLLELFFPPKWGI